MNQSVNVKLRRILDINAPAPKIAEDLVARELRKMDDMDDNRLMFVLSHSAESISRRKNPYDSRALLHGLELIKQRLMQDKAAHADLLPVAVVMARVPAAHLRDAAYLADKLKDVFDTHIANGQSNEWKSLVP